jgi:dTDP-4-dehydrorhamnose 3,5-epimerase
MIFTPLALAGAYLLDLEKREDARGFFARAFCEQEFAEHGLNGHWTQMNTSLSRQIGTVRGMHFQKPPMAEVKMVRCLRGAIFDVIVDLRLGSATFGKWAGRELTMDNRSMLYIPQGFAHGFQTLSPDCELLYFHSQTYSAAHEGGLRHDDPEVGVEWPLAVTELSARDASLPVLSEIEPIVL